MKLKKNQTWDPIKKGESLTKQCGNKKSNSEGEKGRAKQGHQKSWKGERKENSSKLPTQGGGKKIGRKKY